MSIKKTLKYKNLTKLHYEYNKSSKKILIQDKNKEKINIQFSSFLKVKKINHMDSHKRSQIVLEIQNENDNEDIENNFYILDKVLKQTRKDISKRSQEWFSKEMTEDYIEYILNPIYKVTSKLTYIYIYIPQNEDILEKIENIEEGDYIRCNIQYQGVRIYREDIVQEWELVTIETEQEYAIQNSIQNSAQNSIELNDELNYDSIIELNQESDISLSGPVQDPIEDSVQDPVQDPVQDSVQDPVQDPIEDSVKDPVKDPIEDPIEDSVQDPNKEVQVITESDISQELTFQEKIVQNNECVEENEEEYIEIKKKMKKTNKKSNKKSRESDNLNKEKMEDTKDTKDTSKIKKDEHNNNNLVIIRKKQKYISISKR